MLSQSHIDDFFTQGFIVVDLGLDLQLVEGIIQDTRALYPEQMNGRYHHGTRIQDAWKSSAHVKALAQMPSVLETLRLLYLRTPLPFQTLNYPVGTEQPIHSDTIHFNSFPNNFMCGVWVALEQVDADNGPVVCCSGSHRLPEYNMLDAAGTGTGYENYPQYEQFIAGIVREQNLEPCPILLQKGQALIWHGNLLHGGGIQLDKTRSRHSQLTHYFFSGCQYYTPMLSTPERIRWRDPVWVGEEHSSKKQKPTGRLQKIWSRAFKA